MEGARSNNLFLVYYVIFLERYFLWNISFVSGNLEANLCLVWLDHYYELICVQVYENFVDTRGLYNL